MKKITLLMAFITFCSFAFAQGKIQQIQHQPKSAAPQQVGSIQVKPLDNSGIVTHQSMQKKVAFFTEDFQSVTPPALPAGWTTSSLGTDGGFFTGNAADANAGGYWAVATHTTFAMTNDDVCNCDKSADYLEMPQFDFTGYSGLSLAFEYVDDRSYGGNPNTVELNINGAGWNVLFTLAQTTLSWEFINIPLTGTDNQPDVRIRFHYDDAGEWATGLAIDDVIIDVPPANDLAIKTIYYDTLGVPLNIPDSMSTLYYYQIPYKQAIMDSIYFSCDALNNGGVTQPNTKLFVDVSGAGTYSDSSSTISLAPTASDALMITAPFTPSAKGTHNVTFGVWSDSTDAFPVDNEVNDFFDVTDSVYARDDGNLSAAGAWWYGPGANYEVGNMLEIFTPDTAVSISYYNYTNPASSIGIAGNIISLNLYDAAGFNAFTPIASNQYYVITANDEDAWITLPIPKTGLVRGEYVVTVETLNDQCYLASQTAPPLTVYIDSDNGGVTWYYSDKIPWIRLNLQAPIICDLVTSSDSTVAACGEINGTATVNVTGGTAPYSYMWNDPGAQTTATATGLMGGTYSVTVTDVNGCTETESVTITSTTAISVTVTSTDPTSCGVDDGIATATVTGGSTPYTYSWNTIPVQTTAAATGLGVGFYSVSVTDGNNCQDMESATLVDAGAPTLVISDTSMVTCFAFGNGSATVTPSGGTPPYTYLWFPAGGAGPTASGLPPGTFTVTVTDSASCAAIISVVITQPTALVLSSVSTGVLCNGDTDGSIALTVSGATPPYDYLWDDPSSTTTEDISGLAPDTYTVTVTDDNGCQDTETATISEPATIVITLAGLTDETTMGANDGTMSISVTGGTGAYAYVWSPAPGSGQGTSDVTALSPNIYTVTVTDANSCIATYTDTIDAGPDAIPESYNNVTFSIHPNPNNGQFVIKFSNVKKDDYLFEVRNIIGQLIYTLKADNISGNFMKKVDLTELNSGVYFLSISNVAGIRTEKLIVY
ncbi:MAG: T9SS type A sorting domain-containing protein [Bacteroidota bacterium]